ADIAIWDLRGLQAAGSWDPVAALVLCGPHRVRHLIVEGRQVVRDGVLTGLDAGLLAERARKAAQRLMA
ncbi:MAG: 8-oxoguanine deaminase, partial [Rhodobacteraceae bacterium]|nr:8-oxoguanine deaminase [Paracoccaceae bacterium]